MLHIFKTIYQIVIPFLIVGFIYGFHSDAWGEMYGIVKSNRLNIRPAPDLTQNPIGQLYKDMRVLVIERQKEWFKIKHLNKIGYVSHNFLEVIQLKKAIGIVKADRLSFRPIPGKTMPPIGYFNHGTKVQILYDDDDHNNEWLKISYHNTNGYVSRQYVQVIPSNEMITAINNKDHQQPIKKDGHQQGQIKSLTHEKKEIAQQIIKQKKAYKQATEKEKDIIQELDQVGRKLNQSKRQLASLDSEIKTIDKKISSAQDKGQQLLKKIAETEKYVSKRIVSLYKLKRLGASQIFYHADSFSEIFSSYKYLEYILTYDNQFRSKLLADKKRLETVFNDLRDKRIQKEKMLKRISSIYHDRKRQKLERSKILKNIQSQKGMLARAMNSLKQSADNLDQTIADIQKSIEKNKRQTSIVFNKMKAKLRLPVKGKVINQFGSHTHPKLGLSNPQNGLYIVAEIGEPIKAVCPGRVLYADWFKGYGNMIIIDHGDSYYTVYAHADEIFKHKGDVVEQGEVVGTLGDTGSMMGPGLYFEVRHHGKPINPIKWLKQS
jgi:septal ring factor EnvC (AmiA/AmiB activator)